MFEFNRMLVDVQNKQTAAFVECSLPKTSNICAVCVLLLLCMYASKSFELISSVKRQFTGAQLSWQSMKSAQLDMTQSSDPSIELFTIVLIMQMD